MDNATLDRKILFGYQGWFHAAGDGSRWGEWWHHWSWDASRVPSADNVMIDCWPDLSELEPDELFPTALRYADGRAVSVFSSYQRKTVLRHMRWLGERGLDGVIVQRFPTSPWDPREREFRDVVQRHVREGCETYGRVFYLEYDVSSMRNSSGLIDELKEDWQYLVDVQHVLESDRYLHHLGRPVLGLWGGFPGPVGTPDQIRALISWFTRDAPARYRVTLAGGVVAFWRTQPDPASNDPAWPDVLRSFDVIHPWHVGATGRDEAAVVEFRRNFIDGDIAEATRLGRRYMATLYPGFSWSNMARFRPRPAPELNSFPRQGGRFWWRQLYEYMSAGARTFKAAMFDEIDEGTAMFKLAPKKSDAPASPPFLTLDADGLALPSDWYLRLAAAGGRMLRGEIPLSPEIPITPS